jgi:choline-sulfatase
MGQNGDSGRATITDIMLRQSLGRLFHNAGYETVYGGKVHLPRKMNNVQNLGYRMLTGDSRQGLADACVEFIKARHTRPFFLFASFINPHDICYMAINDFRRTKGEAPVGNTDSRTCEAVLARARKTGEISAFVKENCPPLPANHEVPESEPECITLKYVNARPFRAYIREKWTQDQWRLHRWAYCRLTEMVDSEIGTVLDALRESGMEDNTVIVFTSDHGDMDSAHRMEHKSVLYEESVRVPFIMSYKDAIPAGMVDDTHLVSNGLDLLPTLCDYANIKVPKGLHGRSLRPLADGKNTDKWRDFVVSESQNGRMLRTGRFKYCIYDSGRHAEQLKDLQRDPGEMKNLAEVEDYKDVLDKHRQLLRRWVEETADRIAAEYVNVGA